MEEVELLSVEMARVLQFFQWQAGWWRSIGDSWTQTARKSEMQREGLVGYAKRQAAMRDSLAAQFLQLWSTVPTLMAKARVDMAEPLSPLVEDPGSSLG